MKLSPNDIAAIEAFLTDFARMRADDLAKKLDLNHTSSISATVSLLRLIGVAIPSKPRGVPPGISVSEWTEFRKWKTAKEAVERSAYSSHFSAL